MILAIISVLLNSFAQLFLKYGAQNSEASTFSILKSPSAYMAMALYGLSILTWFAALKELPLNTTFPVQALGYVVVFGLSSLLFSEKISFYSVAGLLIICIGVFVLRFGVK